jgi:glycerol uptake facilitator-like aquaporin
MPLKDMLGMEELSSGLGKCLIAEALGTFFINYFGCLSTVNLGTTDNPADIVLISLTFGFIVMIAVQVNTPIYITIMNIELLLLQLLSSISDKIPEGN